MKNVLVTGGSGFIGLNLVETLRTRGAEVRCLVRPSSRQKPLLALGAQTVECGLFDGAALRRALQDVDCVFHLAGLTAALREDELLRVNRDGARCLAEACAAQPNPPRLVLASSIAASGPAAKDALRLESDPPAPISAYGRSKLAGEEAAAALAGELPLSIVRPGVVFGPHDKSLLEMFRCLRRFRFHPVPGLANPPLSFIHVADLVAVLLATAERGQTVLPPGENARGEGIYFGVCDEHPTYADFGRMAKPLLKRPFAPVVFLPQPIPWVAAWINERIAALRGVPDTFNRDKIIEALAPSWACSSAKLTGELQLSPFPPLSERIAQTIAWCFEHKVL